MESKTEFDTKFIPLAMYTPGPNGSMVAPGGSASAASVESADPVVARLVALGLTESKAIDTKKNEAITADLLAMADMYGSDVPKAAGIMLFNLAQALPKNAYARPYLTTLVENIKNDNMTMRTQLDAALKYLKKCDGNLDGLSEAAGFGVVVTAEEIAAAVDKVIASNKDAIVAKRYHFNTGKLMGELRTALKWADSGAVKKELEDKIAALLGPKTEADMVKPAKTKPKKEPKAKKEASASTAAAAAEAPEDSMTFKGASASFHAVGHNDETANYVVTKHTKRLLAEHAKRVNYKVMTRFPPEPNGILHIGHAKAINFNFAYAREREGLCYLRYDDTNPEKEEEEFFVGILRDVRWLGHEPWKITHSSDYFDELYECAVELIRRGGAYICHQDVSEIKGYESREYSPWRERPIEESLKLFEDMKNGLIDEGKATLRMKHVMDDGKLDPVAYRIKFTPHHRTGDKWCIYPTYDFTHCLCDSFEDITHSLCTKEFQNRRASYYWLCNSLDRYCPVQWEYGRLNVAYALVSKRKIGKLISMGIVRGWDDPRLFTLAALRRRGFPPKAINDFCALVGVTENLTTVQPNVLEVCVRDVLNTTAHRAMAVLEPLKVIVEGLEPNTVTVPNIPFDESAGEHTVPICSVIYIDASDFMEVGEKGWKRLTTTQSVGLKHAGLVLTVKEVVKSGDKIDHLVVTAAPVSSENKPKAFIQWVSTESPEDEPKRAQVRVYHQLFTTENPEEGGDMEKNLAENTLDVYDAFVDAGVTSFAPESVFQFERIGFFVVDSDTTDDMLVFNRTVALKDSSAKKK
eukprot:m.13685 g.13685  ORF g.13685 m.13685 type:complete len:806 (+) comp5979_c0_seq2:523-2940(+)